MPLDPQAQQVMEQIAALGFPPNHLVTPQQARLNAKARPRAAGPAVAKVEERTIPGPGPAIPVRIYTPQGSGPFPILVWFHGGGWVIGDLDAADATALVAVDERAIVRVHAEVLARVVDHAHAVDRRVEVDAPGTATEQYADEGDLARRANCRRGTGLRVDAVKRASAQDAVDAEAVQLARRRPEVDADEAFAVARHGRHVHPGGCGFGTRQVEAPQHVAGRFERDGRVAFLIAWV